MEPDKNSSNFKTQYPDLEIDRNLAPIDLDFLGYIARQLRHAAERGEAAVNIHIYRVSTGGKEG